MFSFRFGFIILLAFVILGTTLGKPADDKDKVADKAADTAAAAPAAGKDKDSTVEKAKDKDVAAPEKKISTDERGVLAADQSWEAFFGGNMGTIGGTILTILLVGLLGFGGYYLYELNYASNYPGGVGAYNQPAYPYNAPATPAAGYNAQQYYSPTGRSLDTGAGGRWSWPHILYMISLAQETYEKFDFQTLECQKKALCELSHKQSELGETGRKVSSSFSILDVVEGLPMPTIIQTYLREYREAVNLGKSSTKDCAEHFPKCTFSLKEVIHKYQKRTSSNSEDKA